MQLCSSLEAHMSVDRRPNRCCLRACTACSGCASLGGEANHVWVASDPLVRGGLVSLITLRSSTCREPGCSGCLRRLSGGERLRCQAPSVCCWSSGVQLSGPESTNVALACWHAAAGNDQLTICRWSGAHPISDHLMSRALPLHAGSPRGECGAGTTLDCPASAPAAARRCYPSREGCPPLLAARQRHHWAAAAGCRPEGAR